MKRSHGLTGLLLAGCSLVVRGQSTPDGATLPPPPPGYRMISPAAPLAISPGALELIRLEDEFQQAVAEGGGKAFADRFADDAVILSNGQPAVFGSRAIVAQAQWDPKVYSLTWTALDAQMGPSGDMGYTWGTYVGRTTGRDGKVTEKSGRYMTVWRKEKGGWKVSLEASADEAPVLPAVAPSNPAARQPGPALLSKPQP